MENNPLFKFEQKNQFFFYQEESKSEYQNN